MGLREIKEALRGHPKRPDVHLTGNPKGHSVLTLPGQEIDISPKDTAQQIRAKLTPMPKMEWVMDPQTSPAPILQRVDAAVSALVEQTRAEPPKPRDRSMSITGLKSGAFQGTIEALRQRLIDKQAQGGAKLAAAGETAAAKIDEAVNNAEAKIDKEVSEVLQDFSEFTNGGPA